MPEILKIEDLKVHYGVINAIKGINIRVNAGEIVTLIGANGAGKSSTLNAIMNLVTSKKGKILYEGHDITKSSTADIVKSGIVLVPEGRRIFPNLTVQENLMIGSYGRNDKDGIKRDFDFVLSLFPRIKERLKQPGGTLSGGEQQMLAIGRALMGSPKILLMDEPSLGLAPLLVKMVFEVIKKIKDEGKTILLVEQNATMALANADYAYVLETGKIALEGSGKSLLAHEEVRKSYLGVK
ncbi:ABC transporter ATP-binding protein [Athalassotoga saccharophila]|uniref:ABC transporter ATP-binding protein n=1 Tax=Athalassotoga saccharophila TaxID=1441386 RepID=UPI0013799E7E|nr:ABC transporter ATP-binding protein [Athalassotoga saccharophila]BBJ27347.1 branched-chain amino acid transport ATP-binding protein LivF [Athalassotoga saccharophila]